jgi:hypothetical protein
VPRLKGRATPLLPLWAFVACFRATRAFTFTIRGDSHPSVKHGTFRIHKINAEFGVLTAMLMNMQVLWDVTPHADVSDDSVP